MEPTRYALSGDVSIAYQVHGDGPVDLVFSPGFVSHIESCWEEPRLARFLNRLASFSRLIIFDKRGTGLSDPISTAPTLETRTDDIRAVMDAAESESASLIGWSEGSAMAVVFAAAHPDRVRSLILYGSYARLVSEDPDWPGFDSDGLNAMIDRIESSWGTADSLAIWSDESESDPDLAQWWGRYQRLGASPAMARTLLRWYPTIDVRDVLPLVRVPTIVIHRSDDAVIGADMGRRLAELIPGGSFVLIPGSEHLFFLGDQEPLLTAVEEFVSGEIGPTFVDRFLTSVMFVDIVDSTGLASRLGDRQWTETLATFSTRSERQVDRFQGSILKSTGDGLLAIFDGPARAVACAAALREVARSLGLEIRTGIHTGEVERIGRDIGGIGVHIAARIMAEASPGEILTSSTVRDLVVGSGIEFRSKSLTQLRGMPGEWTLLSVIGDGDGPE